MHCAYLKVESSLHKSVAIHPESGREGHASCMPQSSEEESTTHSDLPLNSKVAPVK